MRRVASIDIGSNSVLLLVAELDRDDTLFALDERIAITRLGKGVDVNGVLDAEAVERTLVALEDLRAYAKTFDVDFLVAVGTAALRDAKNGADFLQRAQEIIGCPVEVISGRREAELVLAGVQTSFEDIQPSTVIFDVGGGSTEFLLCDARRGVVALSSLNIGSVRLTERHVSADPPNDAECTAIRHDVLAALNTLPAQLSQARPAELIGVAGTVTTLLTIREGLEVYDSQVVNGARIDRAAIAAIIDRLRGVTLGSRRLIAGLEEKRADVITAGSLIVETVMEHFAVDELLVCDRGVRWGAAATKLREPT